MAIGRSHSSPTSGRTRRAIEIGLWVMLGFAATVALDAFRSGDDESLRFGRDACLSSNEFGMYGERTEIKNLSNKCEEYARSPAASCAYERRGNFNYATARRCIAETHFSS